jgi:hypothetical protein
MRLILIATFMCIASAAQAQTMVEVHDAPPPPSPPPLAQTLVAPPPPMDLCVVVHALERNDRHARNRALIATGSVLLSAGYATALTLGALTLNGEDDNGDNSANATRATLFVPVLGPFISGPLSGSAGWAIPVVLVDGIAQVAGLALVIHGALSERRLSLTPIVGNNSVGIGFSGTL